METEGIYHTNIDMIYFKWHFCSKHLIMLLNFLFDIFNVSSFTVT